MEKNRILSLDGKEYKLVRVIDKTEQDIHHIISKKLIHKYDVNNPKNKIKISRRKHVALNGFFGDKQNPRDQLKEVFEIVKTTLSQGVRQELYTILYEADDEMFYDEELVKRKKKK